MSCRLRLKFEFFLDQTNVVESDEFIVEIWNPRNSQWHYPYRDGEELHRDIEQTRTDAAKYSNDKDKEQALSWLEKFQHMTSDYPFIKKEEEHQPGVSLGS